MCCLRYRCADDADRVPPLAPEPVLSNSRCCIEQCSVGSRLSTPTVKRNTVEPVFGSGDAQNLQRKWPGQLGGAAGSRQVANWVSSGAAGQAWDLTHFLLCRHRHCSTAEAPPGCALLVGAVVGSAGGSAVGSALPFRRLAVPRQADTGVRGAEAIADSRVRPHRAACVTVWLLLLSGLPGLWQPNPVLKDV